MATRQITCPTCSHAFAVSADARTAICPRCGKALPILASGISLDFEMPIPKKKKSEKPKAAPPPPPPTPQEAKLARISLRKASEKRPARGFEDLSAVTRPASPAQTDLPPAPEATIPGERGYQVEILPRHGRRRDDSDGATGVDLPLRPTAARVEPGQYPESGVGMDEPTAVPHEGELIQVESGTWPSQGQEQVVDDEAWGDPPIDEMATAPEAFAPPLPPLSPRVQGPPPPPPPARDRPPVPPARRAPGPPPRPAPPAPPPRVLVTAPPVEDDPRVTAMRLKAISDDELPPEALEQLGPDDLGPAYDEAPPDDLGPAYDEAPPDDLGPAYDEAPPDLGPPDLGPSPDLDGLGDFGSPDRAAPLDGLGSGFVEPSSEASTISGSASVPHGPLSLGRTGSFHRDLSPSARVAALTDAIDDEVSREIPIPPPSTRSAPYPPQQPPSTMTSLGIGPNPAAGSAELEDDAPLVLPDTGIMVFVPEQPIEERSLGEKPAPAAPRPKSGNTMELSPLQQRRRSHVAGGHGVATRRPSSELEVAAPQKKRLWIALVAGSLALVALVVGLVLALR